MPPLSDFVVRRGKNAWQKHGQDLYAFGNYAEALDAFTKAIQLGQGDYIGILDNRSAAYCALENFESGLSDGRRMIKTDKKDPRGYLRTAKVLQLMKKMDDAIRLYDYALKTLDSESQEYQQIRTLRAKLDRAVNGEKLMDPFMVLPAELISEVLRYLDLRTLLRVIRVSKLWLRLAVPLASGFSFLDLSIARKRVSITAIRAYIQRSHKVLTHMYLDNIGHDILSKIVTLLTRCHKLTNLEIYMCVNMTINFAPLNRLTQLTTLILRAGFIMSSAQLVDILRRCRNLEKIEANIPEPAAKDIDLPTHENLRSMTITGLIPSSDPLMKCLCDERFAEALPNIEELCLWRHPSPFVRSHDRLPAISGFNYLRHCELMGFCFEELPVFPKVLEHLSLSYCEASENVADDTLGPRLKGLEKLKTVKFRSFGDLSVDMITCLLTDAKPSLTSLDLEWSNMFADEVMDLMNAGLFENLTHLNIGGLSDIDDEVTDTIIDAMPSLEVLGLNQTRIGPLSLKSLADTDKLKLRTLLVEGLETPMDRDVIDYVRNKGIVLVTEKTVPRYQNPRFRFYEL